MIYTGLNRTGEIESVKAHRGGDVAEVYGCINGLNPIYYKSRTLTGQAPLSYKALSKPLSDYSISGNTIQNGTPTPNDPVDVVGCGEWDSTEQQYKLPITVNNTEYPIYLGNVPTTRRIKKLVLTGDEIWLVNQNTKVFYCDISQALLVDDVLTSACTHYVASKNKSNYAYLSNNSCCIRWNASTLWIRDTARSNADDFKSYLQQQYAAGTPVTVWYVLATPTTGIVNEPLHKIGDYADTVSMAQASVTIPTIAGTNTLLVDTTVQPSEVSITGNIKEVST